MHMTYKKREHNGCQSHGKPAAVREGNRSAAGEKLHESQPALSRQMKDLEEEKGVTLFERVSRRIRLTEEGMILRRWADEMVRLAQMTESEITRAQGSLSGEIQCGMFG